MHENEKKPLIVAIVLNYNSSDKCKKCIQSIVGLENCNVEVVVIDNASEENDRLLLQKVCLELNVPMIVNEYNMGFSAGNNVGLKYASSRKAEYALIINPDVQILDRNYLSVLVERMMRDPQIAVAAGDMIGIEGDHQNPKVSPSYVSEVFWPITYVVRKFRKKEINTAGDYIHEGRCDKIGGGCMLLSMNFVEEIGYLDEGVFLYMEESILSCQVKRTGRYMYYVPDVRVFHNHPKENANMSVEKMEILWKSKDYFMDKYKPYNLAMTKIYILSDKLQRFAIKIHQKCQLNNS